MKNYFSAETIRCNHMQTELDEAYHDAALKVGLSDSAMCVLYTICDIGDCCPLSEILRLSGASKQTINSALRKLEADGIVRLEAYSGRKKRVCLTDRGRDFIESTVVRIIEIENDILGSWSKEDRDKYFELTRRYLTAFKEKVSEL